MYPCLSGWNERSGTELLICVNTMGAHVDQGSDLLGIPVQGLTSCQDLLNLRRPMFSFNFDVREGGRVYSPCFKSKALLFQYI